MTDAAGRGPLVFSEPDRFASRGPRASLAILIAMIALTILGLTAGPLLSTEKGGPPGNDSYLYLRVIDDLHRGEYYYPAVVREQRLKHYPLKPFVTVRLPTLAYALASLPDRPTRKISVEILAVVLVLAWAWRLRRLVDTRPLSYMAGIIFLGSAIAPITANYGYSMHELWAGMLISLSLALYSPRRWPLSLAVALIAISLRELAAPYLLAMGAVAWREGRRGEAMAWMGGIAALAAGLAVHAALLQPYIRANDIPSRTWLVYGGWKYLMLLMRWDPIMLLVQDWVVALLAPFVLLGILAPRGPLADRLALVVVGYGGAFLFAGRNDTAYWGLMISFFWPLSAMSIWPAIRGLVTKVATSPASA